MEPELATVPMEAKRRTAEEDATWRRASVTVDRAMGAAASS
jgi:hypothetical protein